MLGKFGGRDTSLNSETQRRGATRNEAAEKNVFMVKRLWIENKERDRHELARLWPQQDHHCGMEKPGRGKGF